MLPLAKVACLLWGASSVACFAAVAPGLVGGSEAEETPRRSGFAFPVGRWNEMEHVNGAQWQSNVWK